MKFFTGLFAVLLLCSFQTTANQQRDLFFKCTGQDAIEKNHAYHEDHAPSDPVSVAYKGASKAMMAEALTWPWEKLSSFNEGTELVEMAVAEDGVNPEIRFIRLSIQYNCPSFLGYRENIEEDLKVISAAEYSSLSSADLSFWIKAQQYMLDAGMIEQRFIEQ